MSSVEREKALEAITVDVFKDFAKLRNIKAIFCLILFWQFLILVVIAVFSYIEIQVYRFNSSLLFAILYTVCLAIYLILYFGFHTILYFFHKNFYKRMYDKTLVRNIQSQAALNYSLPSISIFIIVIRWVSFDKLGDQDAFGTPQGFLYGCMSFGCFLVAVCGLITIVTNAASFYNKFIPPSKRQIFEKEIYTPNPDFEIMSFKTPDGKTFHTLIMK